MLLYWVKQTRACRELKVPVMLILPSSQDRAHPQPGRQPSALRLPALAEAEIPSLSHL